MRDCHWLLKRNYVTRILWLSHVNDWGFGWSYAVCSDIYCNHGILSSSDFSTKFAKYCILFNRFTQFWNLSKLRTPSPESASMGLILYLRLRNIINEVILSLAVRTINDTAQHILAPKLVTILGIAKRLGGPRRCMYRSEQYARCTEHWLHSRCSCLISNPCNRNKNSVTDQLGMVVYRECEALYGVVAHSKNEEFVGCISQRAAEGQAE